MSVYEVIFSAANSCISHQLRYVNAVRRIPWYVTVQVRKVHNLEVEVFPFVVNADPYSSISTLCGRREQGKRQTYSASFKAEVIQEYESGNH